MPEVITRAQFFKLPKGQLFQHVGFPSLMLFGGTTPVGYLFKEVPRPANAAGEGWTFANRASAPERVCIYSLAELKELVGVLLQSISVQSQEMGEKSDAFAGLLTAIKLIETTVPDDVLPDNVCSTTPDGYQTEPFVAATPEKPRQLTVGDHAVVIGDVTGEIGDGAVVITVPVSDLKDRTEIGRGASATAGGIAIGAGAVVGRKPNNGGL